MNRGSNLFSKHALLTMGAGFVQKITEVEKSVPGGEVLDESLQKWSMQDKWIRSQPEHYSALQSQNTVTKDAYYH